MNCQQFIFLIVEAARGRLMDAGAREGATRHAETCASCAARLGQEQSLTSALRTLAAADMKDLSAPARVEAKLLTAFQESLAASRPAPPDASPVNAITPAPVALAAISSLAARSSSRRQAWRAPAVVATALAASLALVVLVTLYKGFTRTAPPPQDKTTVATQQGQQGGNEPLTVAQQKQGGGGESSTVAPALATMSPSPAPVSSTAHATEDGPRPLRRARVQRAGARPASPAPAATPRMITSRQVIDGGRAIFAEGEVESAANGAAVAARPEEVESVTEFIPLVAGAPAATPLEGGQLVRVQLPRAALASIGLPLNAERGNEPVKADVLLGNDGMARAIRFVR